MSSPDKPVVIVLLGSEALAAAVLLDKALRNKGTTDVPSAIHDKAKSALKKIDEKIGITGPDPEAEEEVK